MQERKGSPKHERNDKENKIKGRGLPKHERIDKANKKERGLPEFVTL